MAVLDPGTGMGLLTLPDPAHSPELLLLSFLGDEAESIAPWWFGGNLHRHLSVMTQLSSIGWELPEDNHGRHTWFDAGRTRCCDRMAISLVGPDVNNVHVPIEHLLHTADQMQEAAANACLCHQGSAEPLARP